MIYYFEEPGLWSFYFNF